MKTKNSTNSMIVYAVLGVIFAGLVYIALKNITPEIEEITMPVELKLVK